MSHFKIKHLCGVLLIVIPGLLCSCAAPKQTNTSVMHHISFPGMPTTSSKDKLYALIAKRQQASADLYKSGVKISLVGEQASLSIPASALFNSRSANLSVYGEDLMQHVYNYVSTYSLVNLSVRAYSGKQYDASFALSLTSRQSQVVLDFLDNQKLGARFVSAEGRGISHLIVAGNSEYANKSNSRVVLRWFFIPSYDSE